MDTPPVIASQKPKLSRRTLVVVVAVNMVAILSSLPFYRIPSGQKVQAVGWFGFIICIAVAGFVAAGISWPVARASRSFTLPWVVVILGLTPFPLAIALARHAQWLRGFMFQ